MTLIEIRTVKITSKGQIAIPKDVRTAEGFKEGKKIAIFAYDDHVELRPFEESVKLLKKIGTPALMSEKSLAKTWDTKEEDVAWKNL